MTERPNKLTAIVFADEGQYTALCLEIDIAACGESEAAAIEELERLVGEYFDHVERVGIRDFYRPVPIEAIREIVSSVAEPEPHKPARREAEVVSFVPALHA